MLLPCRLAFLLTLLFVALLIQEHYSWVLVSSPSSTTLRKHLLPLSLPSIPSRASPTRSTFRRTPFKRLTQSFMSSTTTTSDAPFVHDEQYELSTGVSMQVMSCFPPQPQKSPSSPRVLLLLHGSFHAAWCYMEHWGPALANAGYTVIAPSWRGTGGTNAGEGVRKVKIHQHVEDLQAIVSEVVPRVLQSKTTDSKSMDDKIKPIVICHSFGGMAVMKYLEESANRPMIGGIVMLCSVPPSGLARMVFRYLGRSLVDSYNIAVGFAAKRCVTNASLCRQLFLGGGDAVSSGISDQDVERYQAYFKRDSAATIDLFDLARKLPSQQTDPATGVAHFARDLPPTLVIGATGDRIVDQEGLVETAKYFGLENPIIVESPHDVMLGKNWTTTLHVVQGWLDTATNLS